MPTLQIPFTDGTESEYTIDAGIELSGNQAQLISAGAVSPYTEDFNDAAGLTFGADVEISGGAQAQLVLQNDPGNDFVENFTNDIGFIYNASYTEFAAGQMQQKDTRPTDATFYASYESVIDGNWGDGTLTGTAVGGAAISGNRLDLSYSDARYVYYEDTGLVDSGQVGCIRFKYTPDYTNSPVANRSLFVIQQSSVSNFNQIALSHRSSGQILLYTRNNAGGVEINLNWHFWQPTAATTYEIEVNFDFTTGATRLFIDGTQQGPTLANTYTRNATSEFFGIGTDHVGSPTDGFFEDVLVFSTVQHTANYVPDWSNIYETIYLGDVVTLPEMEDTNPGYIISFDSFTTTEANSPRYTIQIGRSGDYLYWDGGAWSISNNTYTQANDQATFNSNVATLPVNGEIYGQFRIYTENGNSQMSIDTLTASMTLQLYSVSNPIIDLDQAVVTVGGGIVSWTSFVETITTVGSDAVKYVLSDDAGVTFKWWSGAAWVVSSGYAESNTGAEINTNIASFPITTDGMKIKVYLHSNDGTTTPNIDNLTINFIDALYPTTSPKILYNTSFSTDELESFTETSTKAGSDEIKYILTKDGANYYYSGGWIASDGTYSQSNTASEITTNIATFTTVRTTVTVTAFLYSDTGATTPQLDNIQIVYSYGGSEPDIIESVDVSGVLLDSEGNPVTTAFTVYLLSRFVKYKTNTTIIRNTITVTPDATGYWEATLVETTNMKGDQYYVFDFGDYEVIKQIPNTSSTVDFDDL